MTVWIVSGVVGVIVAIVAFLLLKRNCDECERTCEVSTGYPNLAEGAAQSIKTDATTEEDRDDNKIKADALGESKAGVEVDVLAEDEYKDEVLANNEGESEALNEVQAEDELSVGDKAGARNENQSEDEISDGDTGEAEVSDEDESEDDVPEECGVGQNVVVNPSDRYTEEDRIRMQIICEIHDALHARDMSTVFELCKNIKLDIPAGNSEADVDPDEFRDWPKYNVNNKYASYEGDDYVCGVCHDDADHCHLKYIDVDLLMTDYKELINRVDYCFENEGDEEIVKAYEDLHHFLRENEDKVEIVMEHLKGSDI